MREVVMYRGRAIGRCMRVRSACLHLGPRGGHAWIGVRLHVRMWDVGCDAQTARLRLRRRGASREVENIIQKITLAPGPLTLHELQSTPLKKSTSSRLAGHGNSSLSSLDFTSRRYRRTTCLGSWPRNQCLDAVESLRWCNGTTPRTSVNISQAAAAEGRGRPPRTTQAKSAHATHAHMAWHGRIRVLLL